jgi:hypothetical protein
MGVNMDGWLIQVTSGDPAQGAQQVEMYAAYVSDDDDAVMLVIKNYGLGEEHVVATITDLKPDELKAQGIEPGQTCPFKEDV